MGKEKKEIGMEKLIELLNEYSKKKHNIAMRELNGEYGQGFHYLNYGSSYSELLMVSKKYEFIKWLVENDKIDFDKCGLDIKDYLSYNKRYDKGIVMAENYDNDTFVVREFYSPYEQLLMLLAIQDEPIRFLCEILK